jgi:hypothetical protein
MPIIINDMTITGGTTLTVTDASSNKVYYQDNAGCVMKPQTSANATLLPLFNVGWGTGGWISMSTGGYNVPAAYTSGSGYMNVGGCYNTSTYRFTAPWTGLYLFKAHIYHYYPDSSYGYYYHPFFTVNGGASTRQPGGPPYRIRQYGLYGSYGGDSDFCELKYLTAGDYVNWYTGVGGGMQGYANYSAWSGAYLGN